MHMRGQAERRFVVNLKHVGGYRFSSQASEDGRPHGIPFISDEPDPVGEASGPSTPALLGAAIGHCLSASLLERLRHAQLEVLGCETEVVAVVAPKAVTGVVAPNAEGLPRIDHIEVTIRPHLAKASPQMDRCAEVFENYCTVTCSVRGGIDVRVRVDWSIEAPSQRDRDEAGRD